MDIRRITPRYSVAPQLQPDELVDVREAGFTTLVCNRPDAEVTPELSAAEMERAAREAGLSFVLNPVASGGLTEAEVRAQRDALAQAGGPVLAYCRSGTRSTIVWALGAAGDLGADAILSAARDAGYDLDGLRPELEARARRS